MCDALQHYPLNQLCVCVQRIKVGSSKATEERLTTELVQIKEYVVYNDHFTHRHFQKHTFDCFNVTVQAT